MGRHKEETVQTAVKLSLDNSFACAADYYVVHSNQKGHEFSRSEKCGVGFTSVAVGNTDFLKLGIR